MKLRHCALGIAWDGMVEIVQLDADWKVVGKRELDYFIIYNKTFKSVYETL